MLDDNLTAPPAVDLGALDAFARLLGLLADPTASAARVKALQDAAAEHRTAQAAAQAESAALDDRSYQMDNQRKVHESALRDERAAFDNECAERARVLSAAEEKVKTAQAAADAARERAMILSSDLESRLAMIHGAASAPLPVQRQ
jgi:hypothetical protein